MANEFDLDEFEDLTGEIRRCGSLIPAENMVSAFPPFAGDAESPVWTPQEILTAIRAPTRTPARVTFDEKWIQNQLQHGSCNGFAEAAIFARARWSRGLRDGKLFSGAYAYSLMNGNQDRGSILEDGLRNLGSRGICLANTVTTKQIYRSQYNTAAADLEAAQYKGIDCYRALTKEAWDTALATGLYYGVAAVHAGNNFQRPNQHGIAGYDNGIGNHAVCVDDICEVAGTIVYDVPNSWGLQFGGLGNGRVYVTWDSFRQTFGQHVFYLIPCTTGI